MGFFSFRGAPPLDPVGPSPGIPFNTLGISSRISTCDVMKNCMRNSGRGNNFTREIVTFRPLLRNILYYCGQKAGEIDMAHMVNNKVSHALNGQP